MIISTRILFFFLTISFGTLASVTSHAEGNVAQGKIKSQICVGCHNISGYLIAFPTVYSVPRIQGQSASYIEYALNEYALGNRYTNRMNKIATMPAIASSLTDEDIQDLAAYYSSLGK